MYGVWGEWHDEWRLGAASHHWERFQLTIQLMPTVQRMPQQSESQPAGGTQILHDGGDGIEGEKVRHQR